MKKTILMAAVAAASLLLGGCLYPDDQLMQNQIPYEEQLQSVQSAVDQFQAQEGGILPIQTKENNPDIYEKYPIDFRKITPRFLAEPPGNAFETGGIYQYVLINVETDPTVKLIDLRLAEQIRSLRVRIMAHEYPPFKEEIAENVYSLNYEELGYKEEPYVESPYSHNPLPLVISGDGTIYIDYTVDLFAALQQAKQKPKPGQDIRFLLTENSPFVPAYSFPYTVNEQGDPVYSKQKPE